MKTFAKLSLLALAGFSLVACGLNPGPNGQSKPANNGWGGKAKSVEPYKPSMPASIDDGYVEPTPDEEEFPTYRLPKEAEEPVDDPNIQPDNWAGYTPADPPIAEPITVYRPYEVVCDLVLTSFGMAVTPENCELLKTYGWIEELDTDVWFGGCAVYFNYDTSDYLVPVLNYYFTKYLPAYVTVLQEAALSTLSGDDVGIAYLACPENAVIIQALDYINDSGEIHIEFLVAYPEYFQA